MNETDPASAPLSVGEWRERYFALLEKNKDVAHEITNQQQAIESCLFYLEPLAPREQTERTKRMISTNVQDTKAATRKLVRVPEGDWAPGREPVELRPVLERVVLEALPAIRKQGLRLCVDDAGGLPQVWGTSPDLYQVFTNLVKNALEAMPKGGRLSVSPAYYAQDGFPERVEVRVEDTGPGIPREHHERIFQRGFTTKHGGSGVGLPSARSAVLSFGGAIWVESEPGFGAAFTVSLPVAKEKK